MGSCYEGLNVERLFVLKNKIPLSFSGQVTKDKKDANIKMEMTSSVKYGEGKATSLGFDMQTVGNIVYLVVLVASHKALLVMLESGASFASRALEPNCVEGSNDSYRSSVLAHLDEMRMLEDMRDLLGSSRQKFWYSSSIPMCTVNFVVDKNGTDYSPEELVAMVLTYTANLAEFHSKIPIKDALIAVPPYFGQAERRGLLQAAELAGINVLSLINEYSGAALQYGIDKDFSNESRHVVFYDMGSSSTYAALVYFSSYKSKEYGKTVSVNQFQVKDVRWNLNLVNLLCPKTLTGTYILKATFWLLTKSRKKPGVALLPFSDRKPPGVGRRRGRGREDGPPGRQGLVGTEMDMNCALMTLGS
ncbi:hypothetical protein P8452_21046 [Trifolium repens]|nr:hypothetical protein P8452_21046 [Trifolium repens]